MDEIAEIAQDIKNNKRDRSDTVDKPNISDTSPKKINKKIKINPQMKTKTTQNILALTLKMNLKS